MSFFQLAKNIYPLNTDSPFSSRTRRSSAPSIIFIFFIADLFADITLILFVFVISPPENKAAGATTAKKKLPVYFLYRYFIPRTPTIQDDKKSAAIGCVFRFLELVDSVFSNKEFSRLSQIKNTPSLTISPAFHCRLCLRRLFLTPPHFTRIPVSFPFLLFFWLPQKRGAWLSPDAPFAIFALNELIMHDF